MQQLLCSEQHDVEEVEQEEFEEHEVLVLEQFPELSEAQVVEQDFELGHDEELDDSHVEEEDEDFGQ